MSASEFSNVIPTLEPLLKETLDKNNFKDMKLLKSIHDESFDIANEFFSSKKEGFEDDDEEGFEDDDEEGFENDDEDEGFEEEGVEGMKSKSKSKSKKKKITYQTNFDIIGWAVEKAKGTKNDVQLVKNILNSLFVTFLSFLIAHNWYYTFFINPTSFRFEDSFSFLKENEFIHFFTMYIVQIVKTIEEFIMVSIPGKLDFLMTITPFGRRSIFYFIFSVSLGTVPYFLKQIKSIFLYFEKQIVQLIKILINYKNAPGELGKFIRDTISKLFDSIFMFKGNPVLSPLIGVIYVMKFMENMVIDHAKGIIENATSVVPAFFAKLLAGSIFYIIYIIFKFAMFYQPTIAFSSLLITVYLFYFSVVRLPSINGLGVISTFAENSKHMNDGRVLFKYDIASGFKNNIEEVLKFITSNAHQFIMLFALKSNINNVLNIDSRILKTVFAVLGITASAKLLFSILKKYGVGNLESKELSNEIENITSEITAYVEAPEPETETGYNSMFDRIYKPFKTV